MPTNKCHGTGYKLVVGHNAHQQVPWDRIQASGRSQCPPTSAMGLHIIAPPTQSVAAKVLRHVTSKLGRQVYIRVPWASTHGAIGIIYAA
jgi:hypothetical protein